MARKTKQEAQATRNQILDAAEHVFYDKGVSHTSLKDIATAAGVTRGAIYWHFDNKIDVFTQMHERVYLPIEALAEETASANEPDPLGGLRRLMILVLQDTVANKRQQRVLQILLHKCEFIPEMGALLERQTEYYTAGIQRGQRSLDNAVALGQLPADLDTRKAAIALNSFVRGLISDWLQLPESFDLLADAESLIDAQINMLKTAPSLRGKTTSKR